jgi:cephalosporin-C deacetylase-like acetyl esterase
MNPRSRQIYDEPTWTGYEVVIDVFPDVFAQGILLLPKGMKPDERRPVVVCQHGLEGTPQKCIEAEKGPTYDQFARKLVEKGYVVYCPQNPYKFENHFRQIQRKANPLKLSLFSFIIAQHRRTIDWLETLPNVDPKRIAFYGLSYGGKTAMRVPAVEKRYCLSICSGDFNEWVGKCVSVDLDRSYMWTREYDMYEFDLGNTFNYAEMAYLIAPRPFMVERGHDDPVGTDEMVAYEYAKVRYLYANKLKIPDRTEIEFFPGGHRINGKGTFEFLEKHLGKPRP